MRTSHDNRATPAFGRESCCSTGSPTVVYGNLQLLDLCTTLRSSLPSPLLQCRIHGHEPDSWTLEAAPGPLFPQHARLLTPPPLKLQVKCHHCTARFSLFLQKVCKSWPINLVEKRWPAQVGSGISRLPKAKCSEPILNGDLAYSLDMYLKTWNLEDPVGGDISKSGGAACAGLEGMARACAVAWTMIPWKEASLHK